MKAGWNQIDNEWYFQGMPDSEYKPGELYTNVIKPITGVYYAFDGNGKMLKGFMSYTINELGEKCPDTASIVPVAEMTADQIKNATAPVMLFDESNGGAKVGEVEIELQGVKEKLVFELDGNEEPSLSTKNLIDGKLYHNGLLVQNHVDLADFVYELYGQKFLCKYDGTLKSVVELDRTIIK